MSEPTDSSKTYLALKDEARDQSIKALQPVLANTLFMEQLYKKYHWHVEGEDFYALHLLFDKYAAQQLPLIDATAERIRTLGGKAEGMPDQVVANTTLTEPTEPGHNGHDMIKNLLLMHQAYLSVLREAADITDDNGDDGTNDLVVSQLMRVHELQSWFIRSSASRHEA
jgi:starvation-inducible DNA-binding protein